MIGHARANFVWCFDCDVGVEIECRDLRLPLCLPTTSGNEGQQHIGAHRYRIEPGNDCSCCLYEERLYIIGRLFHCKHESLCQERIHKRHDAHAVRLDELVQHVQCGVTVKRLLLVSARQRSGELLDYTRVRIQCTIQHGEAVVDGKAGTTGWAQQNARYAHAHILVLISFEEWLLVVFLYVLVHLVKERAHRIGECGHEVDDEMSMLAAGLVHARLHAGHACTICYHRSCSASSVYCINFVFLRTIKATCVSLSGFMYSLVPYFIASKTAYYH